MAKQNQILGWLHKSGTAHSIKDLEKALPSVASINGMQVKDFLQALSDEGKIRTEKIGSGNWYWSFLSEEKRDKEKVLKTLAAEKDTLTKAVADMQHRIAEAGAARQPGDHDKLGRDRSSLVQHLAALQKHVEGLRSEVARQGDHDPTEVLRRKEQIPLLRGRLDGWTNNIYTLEQHYLSLSQDRESLEGLRREIYGDEYVEGEGLAELDL